MARLDDSSIDVFDRRRTAWRRARSSEDRPVSETGLELAQLPGLSG